VRTIVTRTAVEGHRALGRSGTQPQRNGSRLCDENALVGSLPSTFIWGYLWGYLVRPEDLTLLSHNELRVCQWWISPLQRFDMTMVSMSLSPVNLAPRKDSLDSARFDRKSYRINA
jgi:hypothetical protein